MPVLAYAKLSARQNNSAPQRKKFVSCWLAATLCLAGMVPANAQLDGIQIRTGFVDLPKPAQAKGAESLEDLDRAVRADTKNPSAYFRRAHFLSRQDKRPEAIRDATTALSLDPKYAEAWLLRSEMYALSANYEKALADANQAISLYPYWNYALGERARLYRMREKYNEAIADANKALSIEPRDVRTLSELFQADDALGDHRRALDIATLNLAIAKTDDPDQLYFALHERGFLFHTSGSIQMLKETSMLPWKTIPTTPRLCTGWRSISRFRIDCKKLSTPVTKPWRWRPLLHAVIGCALRCSEQPDSGSPLSIFTTNRQTWSQIMHPETCSVL